MRAVDASPDAFRTQSAHRPPIGHPSAAPSAAFNFSLLYTNMPLKNNKQQSRRCITRRALDAIHQPAALSVIHRAPRRPPSILIAVHTRTPLKLQTTRAADVSPDGFSMHLEVRLSLVCAVFFVCAGVVYMCADAEKYAPRRRERKYYK